MNDAFEYFSKNSDSQAIQSSPIKGESVKIYDKYSAHMVEKLNELKNDTDVDRKRVDDINQSGELSRGLDYVTYTCDVSIRRILNALDDTARMLKRANLFRSRRFTLGDKRGIDFRIVVPKMSESLHRSHGDSSILRGVAVQRLLGMVTTITLRNIPRNAPATNRLILWNRFRKITSLVCSCSAMTRNA